MGYRCDWRIESEPSIGDWLSDGRFDDERIDENVGPAGGLEHLFDFEGGIAYLDYHTWRTHHEDMLLLSRDVFPNVLFHVTQQHPSGHEVSHYWYKGGKSYAWHPIVAPPPFDPRKLE